MTPSDVTELLRFANYAKVGRALGVTRATVSRWAQGREITPYQERRVRELLETPKGAAPDWERLEATVYAIADRLEVSAEEVAAHRSFDAAVGESPEPAADDDPPESSAPEAAHGAGQSAPRGR